MLSMFRVQHVFYHCKSLRSILIQARCSPAYGAHRAWVHKPRCFVTQSEPRGNLLNVALNRGVIPAQKQYDRRKRLSAFWTPTGGIEAPEDAKGQNPHRSLAFQLTRIAGDSHSLLIRGGFLRQAHTGLFQFLPLGLRIQEKLEKLLDKHMTRLGASKISLSTFSSQELWKRTGRLSDDGANSPGIFQIQDRKEARYVLSPTHEEEITTLVGSIVKSYKDLPLKLYQITRKYRDEARPRQGLLRTREFLMKDLYTFDISSVSALESYEMVRRAYIGFFDEFKIPYMVAKASSGEMGGDLSHEFHFPTTKGEDNIVSCDSCGYVANEELAEVGRQSKFVIGPHAKVQDLNQLLEFASKPQNVESSEGFFRQWFGHSTDGQTMVQAVYPTKSGLQAVGIDSSEEPQINPSAIGQEFPGLDLSVENPQGDPRNATKIYRLYDATILPPSVLLADSLEEVSSWPTKSSGSPFDARVVRKLKKPFTFDAERSLPVYEVEPAAEPPRSLLKVVNGNQCAKCKNGRLRVQTAVELGHTFHLGTRYTKPLNATVFVDSSQKGNPVNDETKDIAHSDQRFIEMGCHGIGVSRLIAAVADALVDTKGLNWPRVMAPFEAIVVPAKAVGIDAHLQVYDVLAFAEGQQESSVDVILDDRQRDLGWKLRDADMIGYPVIVVIGRGWVERKCEVQCRSLGVKEEVPLNQLKDFVLDLLEKL